MRKWQRIRERHKKLQAEKKPSFQIDLSPPFRTFTHSLILPLYTLFLWKHLSHFFFAAQDSLSFRHQLPWRQHIGIKGMETKGRHKVRMKEWEREGPRMRVKDKVRSSSSLWGCYSRQKSRECEKKRVRKAMEKERERIKKGAERVSRGKERWDSKKWEVSDKKVFVNKQKAGRSPLPINTSAYST